MEEEYKSINKNLNHGRDNYKHKEFEGIMMDPGANYVSMMNIDQYVLPYSTIYRKMII